MFRQTLYAGPGRGVLGSTLGNDAGALAWGVTAAFGLSTTEPGCRRPAVGVRRRDDHLLAIPPVRWAHPAWRWALSRLHVLDHGVALTLALVSPHSFRGGQTVNVPPWFQPAWNQGRVTCCRGTGGCR